MDNEDKLIHELIHGLINSPTRPEEIQICPICGGKLQVGFGAYNRYEEDLFGATVECESCGIAMALDYGIAPPPWLKTQ